MGFVQPRLIAFLACIVLLSSASDVWAWGPTTHIKLASDLLSHLSLLPAAIAALITTHRRHFLYGNVATDTVLAKKMSKVKQVCHRWATGFSLLDSARTNKGRAFAYGYLAHLAADTVAHNKFLPRQMAVSRSTISFGHFYWEVRSDARIDQQHWRSLRKLVRGSYPEPEKLLESHLRATLLSFKTNRVIFKQMNLLASEKAWRRSVEFWARISRYELDDQVLRDYHEESLGRILDVLTNERASGVLHEDPNGNAALGYAKAQRKQLRQLKRARIPDAQVIREAAAGHAPMPSRALTLTID
ncbi:MAG: zinc dependent phospholipase C family protein [Phycisphaerales bacterium]|nr:zinc dependent phospholipase C family protein [Phycisphaerales bacterium]